MAKIYMVRHQANGLVHEYPFAQKPTEAQLDAISRLCFQRHGFSHPKTPDEPYWTRIVEVDLLGPNDAIEVPERDLSAVSVPGAAVAASGLYGVSGAGHVTEGKV
jgi:hypothetical protein